MITRRNMLFGLLAAPAIIRTPGLLMPVKQVLVGIDVGTQDTTTVAMLKPGTYDAQLVACDFGELERKVIMTYLVNGEHKIHHVMRL